MTLKSDIPKNTYRILLVDDDEHSLTSTKRILELESYQVITAINGEEALILTQKQSFDLVISDIRMPKMSGLDFLNALNRGKNRIPVILMTAYGSVEDAVYAMKKGAVDFIVKPFKRQELISLVESTIQKIKIKTESVPFIGLETVKEQIQKMAPTHASVLILGESGTGKELIARSLHDQSQQATHAFVAINCAAVPEALLESELFGHEKGAFTGANTAKLGLFESAHEGTLFLDEIGDMPLSLQAKLLRVLQDGEVRRLGSVQSKKVNVRIIAATHQDLKAKVKEGSFRADLLFRLEVLSLNVPPLRERREDFEALTRYYLKLFCERHEKTILNMSPQLLEDLKNYSWPGNVRELQNTLERAVIMSQGESLVHADFNIFKMDEGSRSAVLRLDESSVVDLDETQASVGSSHSENTSEQDWSKFEYRIPMGTSLKDVENLLIQKTLEATQGDKAKTAKLLGIHSRTIYRKLKEDEEL